MSQLTRVAGTEVRIRGRLLRIAKIAGDKYVFVDNPRTVAEGLRKSGVRVDLFTFLRRLGTTELQFPYYMEWDNLAVLQVSTFEHWLKSQIRFAPRGRLRQAQKAGIETREITFDRSLVEGIWEIYNECPIRQGKRFPHYGKDMETVHREEATFLDKSIFIGAFLGEKLVGFVKLVHDETRTQANMMNIVSMAKHRGKCPTNALIAQAVRSCANRKIQFLVYQNFLYPNRQSDGLSRFKEANGFQRVDVPRYYVPLSRLGRIALKWGFHHRLFDRLPEPIAARVLSLRTAWYNRKMRAAVGTP